MLQYLWGIAPFVTTKMLDLPMPAPTAMMKFLTVVDGSWSIDAGIRPRRSMGPYREIHQYSGVANGHTFQVVGPFGIDAIPMHIDGELQDQGRTSRLYLTIHTSLATTLVQMRKTIVMLLALVALGVMVGWFAGVDIDRLPVRSIGQFIFVAGGFFCAVMYASLVWQVHRQTELLLNRFRAEFGASPVVHFHSS